MAKIVGRNALVYIGGTVAPNRNQVTINFNLELQEARTFQDVVSGGPWSDQLPGFRNWTVNVNGYYDNSSGGLEQEIVTTSDVASQVIVYESRTAMNRYWYGNAFFTMSEEIGVDDVVTLNLTGTGTGALTRISGA